MSIFPDADEWNIVDTDNKQNGKNKSKFCVNDNIMTCPNL